MKRRAPRRPSPERAHRRREIIAAAIRLCAERGMENVSYGDLARATRLSRPLIYFYFPDLQTLFMEALLLSSAELHRRFLAAVDPAQPGLAQINAIGRAYFTFAQEEPALFAFLAHDESKQPKGHREHPLRARCLADLDSTMSLIVGALQRGRRDGSIRRDLGDPGKVAVCLWGLTHGLIQLAITKQPVLEDKLGAPFADLPAFGLDLIARSLRAPAKPRPKK
ncbi:MAG: TetR/AcrR family transcriptional regulator [Opitutae bacterium]|nr:TetR/AcrR family transcriptional regulator [Opitutae bacterium]